jgi:hypothetical protein
MARVPGTINTKAKDERKEDSSADVRVVYAHPSYYGVSFPDLYDLPIRSGPYKEFFNDFYAYLVQQRINDQITKSDKRLKALIFGNIGTDNTTTAVGYSIWWIDRLLSVGIENHRKNLLYWVLAPYLITVRKMDYDKAYAVLEKWLDKCHNVCRLQPDWSYFRYRIGYCLDLAARHERLPIKFQTFMEYYPELYSELFEKKLNSTDHYVTIGEEHNKNE